MRDASSDASPLAPAIGQDQGRLAQQLVRHHGFALRIAL
jgi:hypothetical protein